MKLALVLILAFSCGCSMFQKNKKADPATAGVKEQNHKILEEFEKGNKLLDERKFKKAKRVFNNILKKNPVTSLDLVILFNSGIAYEGLNNCKMAAKRYRRVVRSASEHKKLKANALFRLSYAYVCLGQNSKAIVNLIDVRKRRKYLPEEVGLAEVPARLAAAYARNGNKKLARSYFLEAEHGIRILQARQRNPNAKKETLARTLFLMGKMQQLNPNSLDGGDYLESVRSLQGYLLQSVELQSKNWSMQAKEQLVGAYTRVWDLLEAVPQKDTGDRALSQRERLKAQGELAQTTLFNIEELRGLRFPDSKDQRLVKELFYDLNREEKKLQKFLADNNLGNSLTEEAAKRQGLKREGRTYKPNPILERKAKRPTALPPKKVRK